MGIEHDFCILADFRIILLESIYETFLYSTKDLDYFRILFTTFSIKDIYEKNKLESLFQYLAKWNAFFILFGFFERLESLWKIS